MRSSSRWSWSRALDWSGARLSLFERTALCLAACLLVVYGSSRLHARLSQARESDAFDQERRRIAQERLYEKALRATGVAGPQTGAFPEEPPPASAHAGAAGEGPEDPVRRAEALFAPEPELDRRLQDEWSSRRRRAYEESLTRDGILPLGRLEIPDIDLSVMVLPGTDDWTLNRAVGHIEGTSLPGGPGNVGIAGHRDGFFRGLRKLEPGARILLTTLEGTYEYVVEGIRVVLPTQVDVLEPSATPSLTLVTCYPFFHIGSAPQRYIIRARLAAAEVTEQAVDPASSP